LIVYAVFLWKFFELGKHELIAIAKFPSHNYTSILGINQTKIFP
jgi:hypothetical protein